MTLVTKTVCPACSHKRRRGGSLKCLSVFENGNKFCHHCGYDSAKDEDRPPRKEYRKLLQKLPDGMTDEDVDMFKRRGITMEVLRRNKISSNGREILFPYIHDGEIVNIKYRDKEKKFRQEKDAMKIFYGLDDIKTADDIFIVEGEFDKLACEVAGFDNVVSVPDGAPSVDAETFNTKFQFIDDWEHLFNHAERIIIAVDNDPAGKKLEQELTRRFDPERCWTVKWPEGSKDANQVLIDHGSLELMTCLENPAQVPIEGLFSQEDISDDIDELYANGLQGGLDTGWPAMDEIYSVRPGEMTVVTGIPSHGKSSWLTALIVNIAEQYHWKFAIFSPENQPMARYASQIMSIWKGKPFKEGVHERMTKDELRESKAWLQEHITFMLPNEDALGIDDLLAKARQAVKRYGINGFIIDPWNEVDHKRPNYMTETEFISSSLTKIRQFARRYDVHVWIVAHPAKMIKSGEKDGKATYPIPTAYDISGSAHWYNKADNIISVYRNIHNEAQDVEINVQKVRFREVGRAGSRFFSHDIMTGRYKASISQKSFSTY